MYQGGKTIKCPCLHSKVFEHFVTNDYLQQFCKQQLQLLSYSVAFLGKKELWQNRNNQERAFRIMHIDNDSLYSELLRDAVAYTMLDKRLRSMLLHVFKSLKGMNTKC